MAAKEHMKFGMLMPWATLMLLFSCGAGTINCITLNGNDTDFVSLLDFKRAIFNDPTGALSSWNTTIHFCSWQGVVCSQTLPERVVKLNLSDQALDGHISPSLGNISYLASLDLSTNKFSGQIPPHLGNLCKLKFLDLGSNSLQGNIPDAITNCSSLLWLYLQGNLLVGEIPKKLDLLPNLLHLWLFSNNISGTIPPDLGNITTLQHVILQANQFHGSVPEELGKLSNMTDLLLGGNRLSGGIPVALFNLSSIKQLAMPLNMLHGPLPSNIGDFLPNLQSLLLGGNMLGGYIPESLCNASELQLVDLEYNYGFTGKIPPLGTLQKLKMLALNDNNLTAEDSEGWEFLDALTNCTLLERLSLSGNQLQGILPNSVGNLSANLQYLMLGSNMLYGLIPPSIGNLHKLTKLEMKDNNFTGPIDAWIGNMFNLQGIYIQRNNFSGHIPDSIGNISKLAKLILTGNHFHGPVPSSLGKLPQLSILDLSYNNLQGNIPNNLIASTVVQCSLSHNNFEGQIPYVGNLQQLNYLDLSSNKLTGDIPPSLGTCQQLQNVMMDSNFLSGSIPISVGNLSSLTMLNLSHNNFSGSIPISLSKLRLLTQLDMSHNHLDGEVPTEGVFKNTTAISLEGNWRLCGGVLELHMPPCANPRQKKIRWKHYFVRIVIPIIGIVSLTLVIYFIISRKKVKQARLSPSFSGEQFPKVSYKDLAQATENFAESNLVGRGSHGLVYKGRLIILEPIDVAVKVFNLAMEGTNRSFISECQALRNIRHRNLVPILTACSTIDNMGNDFKALVYRLMPNGSLDTWLHSPGYGNLDLSQRLKIIVDIADTLQYIHHDCETPIVHCDLKPSNILLDDYMAAHLTDFGIARFYLTVGDSRSTGTVNLKGTIGYIAPEYAGGRCLSTCGDVYSFGVVLMEMLMGKRPTDPLFCNGLNIVSFCKTSFPDQILGMVDAYLLEEYQECAQGASLEDKGRVLRCLLALVKVALSCTCEAPSDRMNMREATAELHEIRDVWFME